MFHVKKRKLSFFKTFPKYQRLQKKKEKKVSYALREREYLKLNKKVF